MTGADTVVSWSSGARYSEKQKDAPRTDVSNPARRVHGDFAPSEFGQRIIHRPALDMIEPVLRGRPLARWHGLNVWQAVSRPPYDTPLAFCDLRTVAPDDLVIGRGRIPSMPELELDLPLFAHNPEHRWYYWSHMAMDEALVFSGLESNATGTWRMVPHTAFDNRDCPADAPPRNSVETRCMALWFA